jgi:hypothetical protein
MSKILGGTLVLALATLTWAAPQAPPAGDTQPAQTTTKHAGKHKKQTRSAKHKKGDTNTTSQPAK